MAKVIFRLIINIIIKYVKIEKCKSVKIELKSNLSCS